MAADVIRVEVAFATPAKQVVVPVELSKGATIDDAVAASGLALAFPEFDFPALKKGVWSEVKAADHCLNHGDRVEIYRPLTVDPKEARRRRADKKQG